MLEFCKKYFIHLNEDNIRYCHWKSNEHLDAALNGKTDIDILVHPGDRERFEESLRLFDIKEILSPASKQFPGLQDYLGFDHNTGEFIHLHVHYRLVLGQKYIKNHHLPIEEIFFSNLIQKDGVNIPRPEIELILLVIRAHVKTDMKSLAKHAIKDRISPSQGYTAFPQDIESEFRHLIKTSDLDEVKRLLVEMELPLDFELLVQFFDRLKNTKLKSHHILKMQIYILKSLKDYRRAKSSLIYFSYFIFFINTFSFVSRFKTHKKKSLIPEGLIISIIGADGSGKSTLTKDITKWLSWKLTTNNYYYGIPKNRTRKLFTYALVVSRKLHLRKARELIRSLLWMYIAKYRVKVSHSTMTDKINGEVALTDRYPLKEFRSMPTPMDGPGIDSHSLGINSYFSDREKVMYNSLRYPDLLLVLQVDLEELRRRKEDLPTIDDHKLKVEAVNSLDCSVENVEIINANQPYEVVLLEVKRKIWALM